MRCVLPRDYCHELDKRTLDSLKSIPGFSTALKKYMELFDETQAECLNMASKIRLGPNQLPNIYNLLPPICKVLGIEEPQFYLEMSPFPNAETTGDTKPAITITSALVETMTEEELKVVIAHECGHIACHHVLYHSMAGIILDTGSSFFGKLKTIISLPLVIAFYKWNRCSELSADRAAAIYMQSAAPVEDTMIRLAAGSKAISQSINRDAYRKQAEQYQDFLDDNLWKKILVYSNSLVLSHPFHAVRANEITKWCATDQFKKIISFMNEDKEALQLSCTSKVCPKCGESVGADWKFCKSCGCEL